jgi:NhaA family Na+:H+ antiporter
VSHPRLFLPRTSPDEENFLASLLRQETVGGAVMLAAALVAVIWANSPWAEAYESIQRWQLGPLDLEQWASEGGLTLFFYLAGLELKRELLVGSLRRIGDALVPVVAALCGVATPALIYLLVNGWPSVSGGRPEGWPVPAATDIAFALAVLAVVGSSLPPSLRAFLLTLAVVDDVVVITVIAIVYTSELHVVPILIALALLAVFAALQRFRGESWLWYVPLAVGIWWATHESGIHATVAGVTMGLLTRVRPDPGEPTSPAQRVEHALTPVSAGVAVPLFALMSAGVSVTLGSHLVSDPVVIGVVAGLVIGKPVGVLGGAWLVTRLPRASLGAELAWRDLFGVGLLAGVGFTVALLMSELAFGHGEAEHAKTAVLVGSLISAALASVVLRSRVRARS